MRFSNPGAVIENTLRDELLGKYFQSQPVKELLLDLGCGPRPYLSLYKDRFRKTLGADLPDSPFPKTDIDIYCTATDIPLNDNSIDTVLSTEVMHDMSEPREMLREIHRILKPGGHVVLTTPFVVPTVDGVYDHFRYTAQGLKYLLEKENFDIEVIIPVSDIIGATVTLYIKPWLRFWNQLSKLLRLKIIYSGYNPLFALTIYLPQVMYLLLNKIPFIASFHRKFNYGPIGYISIARKKSG